MSDKRDEALRRHFAKQALPAMDPGFVCTVGVAVACRRRRRLLLKGLAGLALAAVLVGPWLTQLALQGTEAAQRLASAVMGADAPVTGLVLLPALGFAAWVLARCVRYAR
jgi:hypothetical protein